MDAHSKDTRHTCRPEPATSPEAQAFLAVMDGSSRRMQLELAELSEAQIDALHRELRERSWPLRARARLLGALLEDPRPGVRRRAVTALETEADRLPTDLVEDLLLVAACDVEVAVRSEVPGHLADWLATLDGLAQAEIVDRWASSESAWTRLAIARALTRELSVPGAEDAIERLASDSFPQVRAAAALAAGARFAEDPERYDALLMDLFWDADARVRHAAASAMPDGVHGLSPSSENLRATARLEELRGAGAGSHR